MRVDASNATNAIVTKDRSAQQCTLLIAPPRRPVIAPKTSALADAEPGSPSGIDLLRPQPTSSRDRRSCPSCSRWQDRQGESANGSARRARTQAQSAAPRFEATAATNRRHVFRSANTPNPANRVDALRPHQTGTKPEPGRPLDAWESKPIIQVHWPSRHRVAETQAAEAGSSRRPSRCSAIRASRPRVEASWINCGECSLQSRVKRSGHIFAKAHAGPANRSSLANL